MTNKKQESDLAHDMGRVHANGEVNNDDNEFAGRDKKVAGGERRVIVGGNSTGSIIIVGDSNTVTNTNTQAIFDPVFRAIEKTNLPTQAKTDVKADVKEIEAEVAKGELADQSFLSRRLRNLMRMAPDVGDVALAAISGPGAAIAAVVKKVAERVKAEASQ